MVKRGEDLVLQWENEKARRIKNWIKMILWRNFEYGLNPLSLLCRRKLSLTIPPVNIGAILDLRAGWSEVDILKYFIIANNVHTNFKNWTIFLKLTFLSF